LGTFITPTLVHFGVVFLIALLALAPEGDSLIPSFGLIGIAGLVYSLRIAVMAARNDGYSRALGSSIAASQRPPIKMIPAAIKADR
jgi:hypothetical protein